MKINKLTFYVCTIALISVFFSVAVAAGPPLKENVCGTCHKDFDAIRPKSHPDVGKGSACTTCHAAKDEASKFSEEIHRIHKGGKTTLECGSCHAL